MVSGPVGGETVHVETVRPTGSTAMTARFLVVTRLTQTGRLI